MKYWDFMSSDRISFESGMLPDVILLGWIVPDLLILKVVLGKFKNDKTNAKKFVNEYYGCHWEEGVLLNVYIDSNFEYLKFIFIDKGNKKHLLVFEYANSGTLGYIKGKFKSVSWDQ
ncbi:15332_t:CDS:2 [Entrophospora sp. SA101]|nr:15332_t:CDS:2 [Entrophospora sp. SA101]